ncbi:hypothetical protein E4V01_09650 [Methylorubrum sp. Q1]|uniref:hypothetical protein n=1 Tax=Methylorubrum sp. Q1 TaxID=2562453 RepID=UPI0010767860|nr:hypothetical protein [Methylorubrum sp. Q1]TFZ58831.1 hypothetical protein E4V01_09650 [Methylorubrum sp. Q1]
MSNTQRSAKRSVKLKDKQHAEIIPLPQSAIENETGQGQLEFVTEVTNSQDGADRQSALPQSEDFVTEVTNGADDAKKVEAFNRAKDAGRQLSELDAQHKQAGITYRQTSEAAGRTAIYEMLRMAECFLDDDGNPDLKATMAYIASQSPGYKPHGGVDNEWQPLARFFLPNKAGGTVTKLGYVLSALAKRKIRSMDVMAKFEEPERVDNNSGVKTGMRKYILFYHADAAKKAGSKPNPFEKWSEERLKENAIFFLEKLYDNGLLSNEVASVRNLLSEKAKA